MTQPMDYPGTGRSHVWLYLWNGKTRKPVYSRPTVSPEPITDPAREGHQIVPAGERFESRDDLVALPSRVRDRLG